MSKTRVLGLSGLPLVEVQLSYANASVAGYGLTPASYLQQPIDTTTALVHILLSKGEDRPTALASFSCDLSIKIMSIHKRERA